MHWLKGVGHGSKVLEPSVTPHVFTTGSMLAVGTNWKDAAESENLPTHGPKTNS